MPCGKNYINNQNHSRMVKNSTTIAVVSTSELTIQNQPASRFKQHHSPTGSKSQQSQIVPYRPKTTKNCATANQSRRIRQVLIGNGVLTSQADAPLLDPTSPLIQVSGNLTSKASRIMRTNPSYL
jgi:hypothetical protein